ncbi:MAG: ABC transporter substrate-binding protein [Actinobacteria bacterium]|nr:ABC transporter substrate-binding protein [Actinomycetota bacterium]
MRSVPHPAAQRRSRRRIAGATLLVASVFVAACGGDDDSSDATSAPSTSATATPATTTAGSTAAPDDTSGVPAGDGDLRSILGLQASEPGDGVDFDLGGVFAMSGAGSYYGQAQLNGAQLAVDQIKAAGGPNINLVVKDHKSGDAQTGAAVTRELGTSGVSATLASYAAVGGSMLPVIEQYKILTLDGAGGTARVFNSKPYFWGTRTEQVAGYYEGILKYTDEKLPDAKTAAYIAYDSGPDLNKLSEDTLRETLASHGIDLNLVVFHPGGTTDFSAIMTQLASEQPDIVFATEIGLDAGYFMKQYNASGLTGQVIGAQYTPDAAEVAGSDYDKYWFASEWFDATNPTSAFSKQFVDTFQAEYGTAPDFYSANAYDDVFKVWQLIRQVTAAGGDITSGEQLQDALMADPTFQTVYGGDDTNVGTIVLDLDTHSVEKKTLGLFSAADGQAAALAYFAYGGADFVLVK